jgi:ferrous iron transport protein B
MVSTPRPEIPSPARDRPIRIAIAGNPNSGKSSLFNELTGTSQSVGNYPGVTVECKEGRARCPEGDLHVTDLPGTYSLTAYSLDERVARNHIIEERPDIVVDVVDAANLERNLYLTTQLMELDLPLVLALNMIDVAKRAGLDVDTEKLSAMVGVPVVPTVAVKGEGVEALIEACVAVASGDSGLAHPLDYGHGVEDVIRELTTVVEKADGVPADYSPRWLAVKLLEGDPEVERVLRAEVTDFPTLSEAARRGASRIASHFREEAFTIIPERRYGFASGVVKRCVTRTGKAKQDVTDRIDGVVCHRFLGPLILVAVVYALFLAVFKVADEWPWLFGRSPTAWVEWLFQQAARGIEPLSETAPLLHSLLADALIGGVGSVMSFIPLIAVLFLFIAFLEDSGYIARVAFIMDRLLRAFGLQGKSILALIVAGGLGGGGCAVPGVMATRTLREEKDRLITILVVPFMNCGAKMPLYLMLIAAFFAARRAEMLLLLWAISWAFTLILAFLLRRFVIRGEQNPFVMELPAYHLPTAKGLVLHAWERTWLYIKKAGTIILAVNVVLWVLMTFPRPPKAETADFEARRAEASAAPETSAALNSIENEWNARRLRGSVAGLLGRGFASVSRFAGFDWRDNIALIGGFAAKEVVVGTLGTAYAMGDVDPEGSRTLSDRLRADPGWSRLRAFAMMIFVMVYAPCMATLAVIRRETGSWRWPLFALTYTTAVAFVAAVAVYQVGALFP